MTLARVLLGGSYTVMMLMLLLHPDHTMDQTWSLHAEIHLRQAMNWAVGLCVTGLALTIWGLRPREQWVWWTLLINGIGLFAGYSAPPLLLAQEPFSPVDLWGLSGLAVLNLLGLILAHGHQSSWSRSRPHDSRVLEDTKTIPQGSRLVVSDASGGGRIVPAIRAMENCGRGRNRRDQLLRGD